METDSFFCQLLKQLPQTLFELMGLPSDRAKSYRFDSVEIKKSLRIDGVMLPTRAELPVVFVEVQFQPLATFYANLFGKVFWYLEENDPAQEWEAAAIFGSRSLEPKALGPYEDLLQSRRVTRIYLDEYRIPSDPPTGIGILQLLTAPQDQTGPLVANLLRRAEADPADSERGQKVIELMEHALVSRFTGLDRKEIREMFEFHDLRKSKIWQEAHEKGREQGMIAAQSTLVHNGIAKGMSVKAIAELLGITTAQVRRLAKSRPR